MSDVIKLADFLAAAPDWRIVSDGAVAFYPTDSLAASVTFVDALSHIAGLSEHRFGIDIRPAGVTVRVVTLREDMMGLTGRDLELARHTSQVAAEQGLKADPTQVQSLLIIPGAPDIKAITPFWRTVLGYVPRLDSPDEDLVDPHDRDAAFWFEAMEEPRGDGLGAIHIAVWVPIEEAPARVAAALAAGGHLVRDDFAPAWWTLADAYGNEVDVATVSHRD